MAAPGITVLKHNVPWGPFTRAQVEDGLARGDFTVKYLAHAPGLKEWLPLGEVLDYVTRHENDATPVLPPVPELRELPLVPQGSVPASVITPVPISRPPILPAAPPKDPEPPPPAKPQAPPIVHVPEPQPEPAVVLEKGPFFLRFIAFLVDCGILFIPVLVLLVLGALSIEAPRLFHRVNPQTLSDDWALLWINMRRMAWLLAVGCGWLYAASYESSEKQATIGKHWMGLKVVGTQGERLSFLGASGRYAAKYLSALPCFLGFIMALFSSRGLALHDRLAGTRVVRN